MNAGAGGDPPFESGAPLSEARSLNVCLGYQRYPARVNKLSRKIRPTSVLGSAVNWPKVMLLTPQLTPNQNPETQHLLSFCFLGQRNMSCPFGRNPHLSADAISSLRCAAREVR
jgi:hypothetical protein